MIARAAIASAPQLLALGIELDDEYVTVADAGQLLWAEGDAALEIARDGNVAAGVQRDAVSSLACRIAEATAPNDLAGIGGELGDEDVVLSSAGHRFAAERDLSFEIAHHDDVALFVEGDIESAGMVAVDERHAAAPEQLTGGAEHSEERIFPQACVEVARTQIELAFEAAHHSDAV